VLTELETLGSRNEPKSAVESGQLPLFAPPIKSLVEEELRKLDINRLTPLDALAKLAELRNKIDS
jgi:hypothetical protein